MVSVMQPITRAAVFRNNKHINDDNYQIHY